MNILPHKSWHVWTEKNVAKVRKDEEEHRQEQERKRKRALEVEQERRVEALRDRNKRLKGGDSTLVVADGVIGKEDQLVAVHSETTTTTEPHKHVNFFEDLERQERGEDVRNPEYEAEKKAQKEKEERLFTTYLGQGAAETQKVKPWYYGPPESIPSMPPEKERKQARIKAEKDPLAEMTKYISKKKEFDAKIEAVKNGGIRGTPAMLARSMKLAAQMATQQSSLAAAAAAATSSALTIVDKQKATENDETKKEKKKRQEEET